MLVPCASGRGSRGLVELEEEVLAGAGPEARPGPGIVVWGRQDGCGGRSPMV